LWSIFYEMSDKKELTISERIDAVEQNINELKLMQRIESLEKDLKILKKVHNLPTHFGGKRIIKKAFNGNYALEGGGIGRSPSPPSDY